MPPTPVRPAPPHDGSLEAAATAAAEGLAERRALGIAFAALLVALWPTLWSFPGTWAASYQEHGFFVGGLVAWLIWRDRHRILGVRSEGVADLLPVVGLLSLAWTCAVVTNVRLGHQALAVLLVTGWAFAVFGWPARDRILPIFLTFLLAMPVASIALPVLQRATVVASGGITKLAGISAVIGPDYVTISSGTFLVEEGCAGLNYLMGGLTLGAIYAHLFCRRWQTQLKVVALGGAVAIVGNWIRVAVLIFIGEATAMQSDLIGDHLWQGWLIFTVLMVPTFFAAERMLQRDRIVGRDPPDPRIDGASVAAEDDEKAAAASATEEPTRPRLSAEPSVVHGRVRRAVFATVIAAIGPLLYMAIGVVPRSDALDTELASLELSAPAAVTLDGEGAAWSPDYVGIDARAAWRLEGVAPAVEVARHYFVDQRQGEELIQWNNVIAADSLLASDRVVGPVGARRRFVREALVRGPERARVVWYWYRVAGFDTPFASQAKLLEIVSFVRRSSASELVTLTAPCEGNQCREAAEALRATVAGSPTTE